MIARKAHDHVSMTPSQLDDAITEYMPIAHAISRTYWAKARWMSAEDLTSEALISLVLAVRSYDPSQAASLSTYIWMKVKYGVLDAMREQARQLTGHSREWGDVAASLDHLVDDLQFSFADPEDHYLAVEDQLTAGSVLADSTEGELVLLRERHVEELTLKQIGARHGYTESRACQKMNGIHRALKATMQEAA